MAANVEQKPRTSGGMASLASTLTGRTDTLARRSVGNDVAAGITPEAPTPSPPPTAVAESGAAVENMMREVESADEEPATPLRSTFRPRRPPRSSATGPRPVPGREGRLEASGEAVVKQTIEVAPQLIHALAIWERDETKRLGQRVFRERVVDLALDLLPTDLDAILAMVADMPTGLRQSPGQLFSTRVRASVRDKLLVLRPELRVAGIKDVRMRDIYSAALYRYLTGLCVAVESDLVKLRGPETVKL